MKDADRHLEPGRARCGELFIGPWRQTLLTGIVPAALPRRLSVGVCIASRLRSMAPWPCLPRGAYSVKHLPSWAVTEARNWLQVCGIGGACRAMPLCSEDRQWPITYLMALMTHGPVSTTTRRRVRISAARRPSVRESDAIRRRVLGRRLTADFPATPPAWGPWPCRSPRGTRVALMPL